MNVQWYDDRKVGDLAGTIDEPMDYFDPLPEDMDKLKVSEPQRLIEQDEEDFLVVVERDDYEPEAEFDCD